jgi:peptidoglycan-associated lipoprotein
MKVNKFVSLLVIGLVLTIAASGCRKKPVNTTPLPGAKATPPRDDGTGGMMKPGETLKPGEGPEGQPSGFPMNAAGSFAGWHEDAQALKADTVYFDFDSSVIKSGEKPKVSTVADYLKANAGKAVRVEGNCDERGTEEYNRALGERRALAVREELIRLGVSSTLIDTKSFGKDNPANDPGHDESAWRKNRRDEFIVLTKPGS